MSEKLNGRGDHVGDDVYSLERALGFRDVAFREYMTSRERLDAAMLEDLSSDMLRHDHPVVRVAGGWVLAQVGVGREPLDDNPDVALGRRLKFLDSAEDIWQDSLAGFGMAESRAESDRRGAGILSIELHTRTSLASLPLLRLAALWHNGQQAPSDLRRLSVTQAKTNLCVLGERLLDYNAPSQEHAWTRNGMYPKLALAMLLQDKAADKQLVLPSHFRMTHRSQGDNRADISVVPAQTNEPISHIQLSSKHRQLKPHPNRLQLEPHDIAVRSLQRTRGVLAALIDQQQSRALNPDVTTELQNLSGQLQARVRQFAGKRHSQNLQRRYERASHQLKQQPSLADHNTTVLR